MHAACYGGHTTLPLHSCLLIGPPPLAKCTFLPQHRVQRHLLHGATHPFSWAVPFPPYLQPGAPTALPDSNSGGAPGPVAAKPGDQFCAVSSGWPGGCLWTRRGWGTDQVVGHLTRRCLAGCALGTFRMPSNPVPADHSFHISHAAGTHPHGNAPSAYYSHASGKANAPGVWQPSQVRITGQP
jgi:hypothetical protein